MDRTTRAADIQIEKPEEDLTPANSSPHTPGMTSDDDSLDIEPAQIKQDIIAERLKTLEVQRKNLGLFKFAAKKSVTAQIETTRQVAAVATQIETAHGGIPLDHDTREFLLELSEKHPSAFEALQDFLKDPVPNESQAMRTTLMTARLFSDSSFNTSKMVNKLNVLINEIGTTRELNNTQFNSDEFIGATPRREMEIDRFQKVLTGDTQLEKGLYDGSYITDRTVIAAQRQYVDSAKAWATENGFENTRWSPGGLSGSGMLFCADWDPIEQLDDGPLKVSRHIGIMLAGRVRMTRVTTEIPGNFSKVEKEQMLARFSSINTLESKAFEEESESQIRQMHYELTQKTGLEKMILKEGALKQAAQFTKQLQADESTSQFIGTLAYLYPETFKEIVDFASNSDVSKPEDILASIYEQYGNNPELFHSLQDLIYKIVSTHRSL